MGGIEAGLVGILDVERHHARAAAFQLERDRAVPGADVKRPDSGKIGGYARVIEERARIQPQHAGC